MCILPDVSIMVHRFAIPYPEGRRKLLRCCKIKKEGTQFAFSGQCNWNSISCRVSVSVTLLWKRHETSLNHFMHRFISVRKDFCFIPFWPKKMFIHFHTCKIVFKYSFLHQFLHFQSFHCRNSCCRKQFDLFCWNWFGSRVNVCYANFHSM